MSSELERRLERALAQVEPDSSAREQAQAAALAAMPHGIRARHRVVLLLAAALAMLVLAGGAVAASSSVREVVGLSSDGRPTPRPLPVRALPPGSAGFAAFGDGRLWLASPGFRASDRPFSAAELSPGALNVAVGAGRNLDVLRMSDGSLAWRHAAGGQVAGIAWAPIGTEIAYVVRHGKGYQLRMIEGDGDHDRLLAAHVSPVAPSWRSDSLAVAFVGGGGRPAVFDLGRLRSVAVTHGCPGSRSDRVAFAPRGGLLAAGVGDGNLLVADPASGWTRCLAPVTTIGIMPSPQFAWVSGRSLVAAAFDVLARITVDGRTVHASDQLRAPAGINGLAVSPDRRQIAFGLWRGDGVHLVTAHVPATAARSLQMTGRVRSLPNPGSLYELIWR